jgi:hypothetical protein
MSTATKRWALSLLLGSALLAVGCGGSGAAPAQNTGPPSAPQATQTVVVVPSERAVPTYSSSKNYHLGYLVGSDTTLSSIRSMYGPSETAADWCNMETQEGMVAPPYADWVASCDAGVAAASKNGPS